MNSVRVRAVGILALCVVGCVAGFISKGVHKAPGIRRSQALRQIWAGRGFGAPRNTSGSDPQLLYYHQQKTSQAATTEYLRPKNPQQPLRRAVHMPSTGDMPPGMRVFDRVVDFPCIFQIKVIGQPQPDDDWDKDILQIVGKVTGKPWQEIEYSHRDTDSGRFRSLTIHAPVANSDQLYEIYSKLDDDPRVKFKF